MNPENQDEIYEEFKRALSEFKEKNVEDLIIDVRNNDGGYDEFGAKIIGLLSPDRIFYHEEKICNPKTKALEKYHDLSVEPDYIGFDKNIIVLVNSRTISAGEGFVYNLNKLSNVKSAGITKTNGSYGSLTDGQILMPENYLINYPKVACLNENGEVMIDSDYTGIGGIKPDLKIPLDMKAVKEIYQKGNDYEVDYILNYLENK